MTALLLGRLLVLFAIVWTETWSWSIPSIGQRSRSTATLLMMASTSRSGREEDLERTRQVLLQKLLGKQQEQTYSPASSVGPVKEGTQPAAARSNNVGDDDDGDDDDDYPANDLMIRVALGDGQIERTPVWLFRQAGRHLPEYRQYKLEQNATFLDLLQDPAMVAECTLQPIRRYNLDAAILFSDILVIPEAMGIRVTMPGGVGIQIPNPILTPIDIRKKQLKPIVPYNNQKDTDPVQRQSYIRDFVEKELSHVLQAVRQIRAEMRKEQKSIPLIGFSAAPWTLLFYMVGGSSKRNTEAGMDWLRNYPHESKDLLSWLTDIVIEYVAAQVDAGCHLIQIFEAMGMMIQDDEFLEFALPCLEKIGSAMKSRYPDIPLMIFCRGACHMNSRVASLGYYNVLTIDGTVDRATARQSVVPAATATTTTDKQAPVVCLQGNYDPQELVEENGKTVETVRQTARQLLEELGPRHLIANLGEGLTGKESPALVNAFVDAIHEESERMLTNNESGNK